MRVRLRMIFKYTEIVCMYDKRDGFDLDIVNSLFLDGDLPRRTSYGIYVYRR